MDNNLVALLYKNSVSAVFASAHDEICGNSFLSVGAFADNDSSANIGVVSNKLTDVCDCVNAHLTSSFQKNRAALPEKIRLPRRSALNRLFASPQCSA